MAERHRSKSRAIVWQRIDKEGMDACVIDPSDHGYEIAGTAIYLDENGPANLAYYVACDAEWRSQSARIEGRIGVKWLSFEPFRSSDGLWTVGGEPIAASGDLLDIDLGFTPATNTNAINRLNLDVGESVETAALWLDVDDWTFKPLKQVYERRSETVYFYSSPLHNYEAELAIDHFGFVLDYPQLWRAITS